jgi:hypothetical protein
MGRARALTELEVKVLELVEAGHNPTDAVRLAGGSPSTAKNAYRIMRRTIVRETYERRKAKIQMAFLWEQCDLGFVVRGMKKAIADGNAATQRLYFELHDVVGDGRLREYERQVNEQFARGIGYVATLLVPYVAAEKRQAFEQKVAELRAGKLLDLPAQAVEDGETGDTAD